MATLNKNKKIIFSISIVVLLAAIFLFNQTIVFGQEDEIIDEFSTEIDARKQKISDIENEIEEYNKQIAQKHSEGVSLNNQVAILDNEMEKTKLNIEKTTNEIEKLNLEIKSLEHQIQQAEDDISEQKEYISEFINSIYQNDQKSYLEVLLINDSLSNFFDQIEYLQQIQINLQKTLDGIQNLKTLLEENKIVIQDSKIENEKLIKELEDQEKDLLERSGVKETLLIQTRRSESQFKSLAHQLQLEQAQINAEISTLERRIREEIAKRDALERFQSFGPAKFIWPTPGRYVTSYFHDPDYPYRYIFEHPAIDIRAAQGTAIKAAESGYIGRAKNAGKGYSYIMIVHNQGFSTVYGHISKILVNEDEFVTQGEIIALSGGTPGTSGAGRLTSGPHLHFEVRLNGIPVNPLEYLP